MKKKKVKKLRTVLREHNARICSQRVSIGQAWNMIHDCKSSILDLQAKAAVRTGVCYHHEDATKKWTDEQMIHAILIGQINSQIKSVEVFNQVKGEYEQASKPKS